MRKLLPKYFWVPLLSLLGILYNNDSDFILISTILSISFLKINELQRSQKNLLAKSFCSLTYLFIGSSLLVSLFPLFSERFAILLIKIWMIVGSFLLISSFIPFLIFLIKRFLSRGALPEVPNTRGNEEIAKVNNKERGRPSQDSESHHPNVHENIPLKTHSKISIYLSYSEYDVKKVSELRQKLENEGFSTFMREDILPGQKWELIIKKEIKHSKVFLYCISSKSIIERGTIQVELRAAQEKVNELLDTDIGIIPILLEKYEIPVTLAEFQWVDPFTEEGFKKLIRAIKK